MPTTPVRRIPIAAFRELGYLQEVNRLLLHPLGLALEVEVDDDGTERLGGIWDYRDDPEGIAYGAGVLGEQEAAKAAYVAAELERHRPARVALFGDLIQPIPT
jgi:hypothetical protein